jgi:hypothetical protein
VSQVSLKNLESTNKNEPAAFVNRIIHDQWRYGRMTDDKFECSQPIKRFTKFDGICAKSLLDNPKRCKEFTANSSCDRAGMELLEYLGGVSGHRNSECT